MTDLQRLYWVLDRWDYKTIDKAPKPCQHVFACFATEANVNNGGFASLYYTSCRVIVHLVAEAFSAVGLETLADITRQANEFYKDVYDEYGDLAPGKEFSEEEEAYSDALDRRFYAECEACGGLEDILVAYIHENAEFFGA